MLFGITFAPLTSLAPLCPNVFPAPLLSGSGLFSAPSGWAWLEVTAAPSCNREAGGKKSSNREAVLKAAAPVGWPAPVLP